MLAVTSNAASVDYLISVAAPDAALTQFVYDDKGGLVTGGKGIVNRLEPGEVATVKIETPFNAKMKANNYNFSHANGTVKPHKVAKLGDAAAAKEPAAKPAAKKK